ncbi:ShlB/FhaC/HecB family hemolysin secretion/activation protein [Dyella sp.]|uniref:ShlB/FhaC/HecB family hemolysin secretion/activation protein n=1 Tax=Dyella sp. TaxID=1869338 RepID=UPI002ED5BD1B
MDMVVARGRAVRMAPWLALTGMFPWLACAQSVTPDTQEQRERAEREAHQREREREAPDVRLGSPGTGDFHRIDLPREQACFTLRSIHLQGEQANSFGFIQRYLDTYAGRCVGPAGINLIARRAGELAIDRGYVTTRIGVTPQSIANGTLVLTIVPGTIASIRDDDAARGGHWRSALPMRPGALLNLRDIEQALEQFKRVPSQDVDIDIAPGDQPGESILVIKRRRTRPWRMIATLDDSGTRATGRGQAGATLAVDNPLGANDLLSLGYNRNAPASRDKATQGLSGNYSMPWGNWLFSASFYGYRYRQTITGSAQSFSSRGTSRSTDVSAQRLLHRSRSSKTTLALRVGKRWAHSYIEDVELDTQRRNTTMAELSVSQRQYLGNAQLDLRLAQRKGVHWFGGMRDPGGQHPDSPRFGYALTVLDASLYVPFRLGRRSVQWTSEFHAQRSPHTLYGSEFIAIGGRYTVRGFDGEQTLAAERGWYWRNTWSLPAERWPLAFYAGLDNGHVGGPSGRQLGHKSLAGGFLGARGQLGRLSWDAFAGWSLRGGRQLDSMRPATGISLTYVY